MLSDAGHVRFHVLIFSGMARHGLHKSKMKKLETYCKTHRIQQQKKRKLK